MRRVRVDALPLSGPLVLHDEQAHHLANVLRVKAGTPVLLFDGRGSEQPAVICRLNPVTVDPSGPSVTREDVVELHLFLAVLKHQPMDLALRMATEAGATHLHPVLTERTVAKGDRGPRWTKIVSSATAQCGRASIPVLSAVEPLRDAVVGFDGALAFGQLGAPRLGSISTRTGLVVGPAGGLSSREERLLVDGGATPVGLGPHILRAETAAAVGIALLR